MAKVPYYYYTSEENRSRIINSIAGRYNSYDSYSKSRIGVYRADVLEVCLFVNDETFTISQINGTRKFKTHTLYRKKKNSDGIEYKEDFPRRTKFEILDDYKNGNIFEEFKLDIPENLEEYEVSFIKPQNKGWDRIKIQGKIYSRRTKFDMDTNQDYEYYDNINILGFEDLYLYDYNFLFMNIIYIPGNYPVVRLFNIENFSFLNLAQKNTILEPETLIIKEFYDKNYIKPIFDSRDMIFSKDQKTEIVTTVKSEDTICWRESYDWLSNRILLNR